MLVLYETPAGYALFQIKDESKIQEVEDITQHFADADSANKLYARFIFFLSLCLVRAQSVCSLCQQNKR